MVSGIIVNSWKLKFERRGDIMKKTGWGTSSIVFLLLGLLWMFNIKDFCLGDYILNHVGLKAWTNGTTGYHIGIYYSYIFLVPSALIAYTHKDDFGSKIVWKTALGFIIVLTVILLAFTPTNL